MRLNEMQKQQRKFAAQAGDIRELKAQQQLIAAQAQRFRDMRQQLAQMQVALVLLKAANLRRRKRAAH
jgi:hypothetical protein